MSISPVLCTTPLVVLLFGVFGLALPAAAAPTAPTALSVSALKATSFTLSWSAATGGTGGIAGYDVTRDGLLIGSTTTARTLAVPGLAPTTAYSMTVTARDGTGGVSPSSDPLLVTTLADTTVPTRPADLAATAITTTSCTLTWTGSTDNVGVTGYAIYRSGVLLGISANTTFEVTGLVPDSTNNLTVRAVDAAGNLSSASVALSVRMLALPPSAPTGLATTALKATSFTLTWLASTGGTGGIAGYDVTRDGTLVGSTTTARTLAMAGLAPTTTYSITIFSRDTAGNVSAASDALIVTTPADTTPPTRPADLAAADITTTSFTLTWTGSTDNVGVTGYAIYRSGVLIGTSANTQYQVTGLLPDSTNNITVRAVDAAGNLSTASVALSVRMVALPPSVPTGMAVTNLKPASFRLTWLAATGGTGGIAGYDVYLNGLLVGSPATRSLAVSGLTPTTSYSMTVASRDRAGNVSAPSEPLAVTTPADTARPSAPTALSAADVTYSSFTLTWTASKDNVGVVGYEVFRNNVLIGTTTTTAYAVTGLAPLTISAMKVKARDAAGNLSAFSVALTVTTSAPPNTSPAIALTAPAADSVFTLPFTIILSALATDSDGTISKVEFYDGPDKLGETTVPVSSNTFTFTLPAGLAAGIHSLTARATDDRSATTDSAPVSITVNNPNQYPTVMLTASNSGIAPAFLTLTAEATDSDGTITKVEFYEGSNLLGEILTPSTAPATFAFPLTLFSTGQYTLTAVATDNTGAQSTSTPVPVTVAAGAAPLPFVANFEAAEGYVLGPLNGQLSWFGTAGVEVGAATTPGSQQELAIAGNQPPEIFSHSFSAAGVSPVFVDFQARPVAGADPTTAIVFSTPAAQVAMVGTTPSAQLWIFGGGVGWYSTGQAIAVDATGRSLEWLRLTTREDYAAKKWDLTLNGRMIAADVPFADASATALTDFSVNGHATIPSAFDTFYVGAENPLFADANRNGLDDAWEISHGLSLATDNRQLSPTGNGVSVLQAYLTGTDPNDFYNGVTPVITVLVGGDGQPGVNGFVQVHITNASGQPFAKAPVLFSIIAGVSQLAAATDEGAVLTSMITLTTQTDGIASVYYRKSAGQPSDGMVTVQAGQSSLQLVFQAETTPVNQPPSVAITAPLNGLISDSAFGLVITASAFDFDGTVAKVEFYADDLKLGECTTVPYYYAWTNPAGGTHALTAKATDNSGAVATSAVITLTAGSPEPALGYIDFEETEGYLHGPLSGQQGWDAPFSDTVIEPLSEAPSGDNVLRMAGGSYQSYAISPPGSDGVVFVDFLARAVVGQDPWSSVQFHIGGAFLSFADDGSGSMADVLAGYMGENSYYTPASTKLALDGSRTTAWHRYTLRLDYASGLWDLFLDGLPVSTDMGLPGGVLTNLYLWNASVAPSWLDRISISRTNPLFADADGDGMEDEWEVVHGLDPAINDREADGDDDGLTNINEYGMGANPTNMDSDGDGLPDLWEYAYGLNPVFPISPIQDTDGDALPDRFEYQTGSDPTRDISSGSGIPDAELDPDGDGLNNLQEYQQGTDPIDYYNGQTPVITPLADYSTELGSHSQFAVRVTNQEGAALVNAPVQFTVSAESLLTQNPYGRGVSGTMTARTDATGVAKIYIRPNQ